MIDDLDQTVEAILKEELPIKNGEIDVKFEQPTREWSARLTKPTVNLFLYDLRENATLRQHHWQQLGGGNGRNHTAEMKRSPFRVDCHYMLTTWANEPDDEHRLMSRALLALFRHPILPEHMLQGQLQNQPFELQAALARHDRLTNPAEVWSALDNEMRPSVSYTVTIALDPWQPVTGPVVRTMILRSGMREENIPVPLLRTTAAETAFIGGTVFKDDEPQAGIDVALKGTGFFSTSGASGTFSFGGVPPGDYILVAWPPDAKPRERQITVPGESYDVEL